MLGFVCITVRYIAHLKQAWKNAAHKPESQLRKISCVHYIHAKRQLGCNNVNKDNVNGGEILPIYPTSKNDKYLQQKKNSAHMLVSEQVLIHPYMDEGT